MPGRQRAVNRALLKPCSIFSEGPRDRRVYFTDDLQDVAGNPKPQADGYRPTQRFVAVGAVYKYLPAKDADLNEVVAQVWEHVATANDRLARKQASGR